MDRKGSILATLIAAAAAVLPASAASAQQPTAATARPAAPMPSGADVPAARSGGADLRAATAPCSAPADGKFTCIDVQPGKVVAEHRNGVSISQIVPFPSWCSFNQILGIRNAVCRIVPATLTTYTVVNGVQTVTGVLNMDLWDYSYTSSDLPNWIHQTGLSPWSGYGPALGASARGTARSSGSCTTVSSSFPTQPLTPFLTLRSGEAAFATTATAIGAVGTCTTTWDYVLTVPEHTPGTFSSSMNEIRCDNTVGANGFRPQRVGCVVPWYPSAVTYSTASYPSLASHVSRAQGSGLPGNSFAAPLYFSTNAIITAANRTLACGDAPSITGLNCDEYPLASTYNGLALGGTRRTFSGCNINAPAGSGPTGASACMITATENFAQGGLHAAFNYDVRLLDNDPFRVLVTP